jgi:two-component SAPR family response regulator
VILISHKVARSAVSVNLAGLSVLILHDEAPTSLELNAVISSAGCSKISTFSHTSIAKLWLEHFIPEVAILDLAVDDDGCYDLVLSLIEKRVPMVIYSKDGRPPERAGPALCGVEWIPKDAAPHTIRAAIQSAFSTMETSAEAIVVSDECAENVRETSGNG